MESPGHPLLGLARREFVLLGLAGGGFFTRNNPEPLRPIVISVHAMLDRGAHSGRGLGGGELSAFNRYQERARREYAISGILFDVRVVEGAFLRTQGYSEIPAKFLASKTINLFVTDTLGYDIDRDRTGGCSTGPRPRGPRFAGDPFYKTFLGLREAGETTLVHEYAHHFTLDTQRNRTTARNLWADLRNDYWLWRQRCGSPILEFRACAHSEWAKVEGALQSGISCQRPCGPSDRPAV
jgi:hypothetical protein